MKAGAAAQSLWMWSSHLFAGIIPVEVDQLVATHGAHHGDVFSLAHHGLHRADGDVHR